MILSEKATAREACRGTAPHRLGGPQSVAGRTYPLPALTKYLFNPIAAWAKRCNCIEGWVMAERSGLAWERFCAALAEAGRDLAGGGYAAKADDWVEAYHHLGALAQQALAWQLHADPDFPRFVTLNDTFEFADNRYAPVAAGRTYRLSGNVSTIFDLNISLHEGWAFAGKPKVWGDIGLADLDVRPNGDFELIVSAEPHPGNWLELPEGASFLHIREYFRDWDAHTPATFEIVRLGSEREAPSRLSAEELEARLEAALAYVRGYTPTHKTMVDRLRARPPNGDIRPTRQPFGNRNIAYGFGRFELTPDERLVLEFDEPQARLWGVLWLTTPWYENPDLYNRFTSVGGAQAFVNADGKVRVVVSAADPGVPNWLDCGGYAEGILVSRWIWTAEDGPDIAARVVSAGDLRSLLPADTPVVDPDARAALLARRRSHFAKRRR
jgi:hypothetical protein